MKLCRILLFTLFSGLALSVLPAPAGNSSTKLPNSLHNQFKRLGFGIRGVSIYVQDVNKRQPLLQIQADIPRNPASVIKLVTTAVALTTLGPDFTWKTKAFRDGIVNDGILDGNLYIKGYGDPFMTPEFFWRFLRAVRNSGIAQIKGDLILDSSYFSHVDDDPGDFDGKPLRSYNVNPNALLVNFQSIRFEFIPDPISDRVDIQTYPQLPTVKIDNRLSLFRGSCGNWKQRILLQIVPQLGMDQVQFSGRYSPRCGNQTMYRVVNNPQRYFEGMFRLIWEELGGQLSGAAVMGQVPFQAHEVHTESSLPLADLIRGINKYSNNVMTRQLLLTMGAELEEPPGTEQKGIQIVQSWLREQGLLTRNTVLDNGAGLSRKTRISARQLGKLLVKMYRQPYMPEYMSSLAINAVDGTMRHRFNEGEEHGHMHMKTGTLDFVRSMAGYVLSRSGKRWVVVMLHNHPRAHSYRGEKLQDALLKWVYRN